MVERESEIQGVEKERDQSVRKRKIEKETQAVEREREREREIQGTSCFMQFSAPEQR